MTSTTRGVRAQVARQLVVAMACIACTTGMLPARAADADAASASPVPPEVFFKRATLRRAQLSPTGRYLALLSSRADRRVGLTIIDLNGEQATRAIEPSTDDDMVWFNWVSDDWLIFSVENPDSRSNTPQVRGLMAVKRDGSQSRMLVQREWARLKERMVGGKTLDPNHYFIGYGAADSNEIVLGRIEWDSAWEFSHVTPMVLNVSTGAVRSLLADAPKAHSWLLDRHGQARVAVGDDKADSFVLWSDGPGKPWREISRRPQFEPLFEPAYVDDKGLVVETWTPQGGQLRRLDTSTGKLVGEPLVDIAGFDAGVEPIGRRDGDQVDGVTLAADALTTVWFNPSMQRLQADVDAQLPGRVNLLSCRPCADPDRVLVHSFADRLPGEFILYHPKQGKLQMVGSARPEVQPQRMAALSFHRTKARDGQELPLWVTRPAPADAQPRPAVVLVHGGPNVRGTYWEWEADAQFLASRGYVVIEPEFRGSMGYGSQHFRAGWKQWGLAMQDDVSDALKFTVGQGWVDPKRVCIMGFSYGGYATLMGLVKDPDQYRCGIAGMAVSDPRFMFSMHWSDTSEAARLYSLPVLMGDPKKDEAQLIATSPLEQAARIKAPVLLAHGGIDRRVPIQNGERMRDALLKHGKQVEWLLYPDEGHGFRRTENRIDFWRRAEGFLSKHLKADNP